MTRTRSGSRVSSANGQVRDPEAPRRIDRRDAGRPRAVTSGTDCRAESLKSAFHGTALGRIRSAARPNQREFTSEQLPAITEKPVVGDRQTPRQRETSGSSEVTGTVSREASITSRRTSPPPKETSAPSPSASTPANEIGAPPKAGTECPTAQIPPDIDRHATVSKSGSPGSRSKILPATCSARRLDGGKE